MARAAVLGRLRRAAQVRPDDVVQLGAAVGVAAWLEWSLRHTSLPVTARRAHVTLFDRDHVDPPVDPAARLPAWAIRRAKLVAVAMQHWPFGDTCLRRALVTGHRLAALSPELVIGVRPTTGPGEVDAHAWLRIAGADLDPLSIEYVAFESP